MIVTERKDLEEIFDNIKEFKKILVLGCNGCTGVYQVGGEKQAGELAMLIKLKLGIEAESFAVLRQCERELVAEEVSKIINKGYDCILSLACGAGVQTVAEIFDLPVLPASNTMFIGSHSRELSILQEKCIACGDCILAFTAGICPKARCAKGLLNGPCGGQYQGKCEVGGYTKPCAWVQIWEKLKKQGKLNIFKEFRAPGDYRKSSSPREKRWEYI